MLYCASLAAGPCKVCVFLVIKEQASLSRVHTHTNMNKQQNFAFKMIEVTKSTVNTGLKTARIVIAFFNRHVTVTLMFSPLKDGWITKLSGKDFMERDSLPSKCL